MAMIVRIARSVAFAVALMSVLPSAFAQSNYPAKPIQMIVPLAAASAVDNAARIVAQRMSQNMAQSIVVENQPGAAGLIGADRVAKAAPDGYTLGAESPRHIAVGHPQGLRTRFIGRNRRMGTRSQ
jgi:tripartite-type tricarboxylate transporter receptor subunit TctC